MALMSKRNSFFSYEDDSITSSEVLEETADQETREESAIENEIESEAATIEEEGEVIEALAEQADDNEELIENSPEQITEEIAQESSKQYLLALGRLGMGYNDLRYVKVGLESSLSPVQNLMINQEGVIETIKNFFKRIWDWIKNIGKKIKEFFARLFNSQKRIAYKFNKLSEDKERIAKFVSTIDKIPEEDFKNQLVYTRGILEIAADMNNGNVSTDFNVVSKRLLQPAAFLNKISELRKANDNNVFDYNKIVDRYYLVGINISKEKITIEGLDKGTNKKGLVSNKPVITELKKVKTSDLKTLLKYVANNMLKFGQSLENEVAKDSKKFVDSIDKAIKDIEAFVSAAEKILNKRIKDADKASSTYQGIATVTNLMIKGFNVQRQLPVFITKAAFELQSFIVKHA